MYLMYESETKEERKIMEIVNRKKKKEERAEQCCLQFPLSLLCPLEELMVIHTP